MVVDMQNDYCHEDGLLARSGQSLFDGDRLVDNIQRLTERARGAGVHVVFVKMTTKDPVAEPVAWARRRREQGLSELCRPGTWGQQIVDQLTPHENDLVVEKSRFSAFFDTPLAGELRDRQVETVVFTGVTSNGCVDLSVRDGFQHGFAVVGVADAVGGFQRQLHDAAIGNWQRRYGEVLTTDQMMSRWK
ncbi:cysteine hydrolase family protein [Micromonospora sp. NPDC048830]|uniref:cysteine hydrolase family protein n=1 Tax=Micromonospora sp. NPDC048830 TaxID=3364257 RepID=UPI00371E2E3B